MYCKTCGKEIHDEAVYCPHCGCATEHKAQKQPVKDAPSDGWAFLGFLFPLIGLILYLFWQESYPLRAKSVGKGALVSVIVSVVVFVFAMILTSVGLIACDIL